MKKIQFRHEIKYIISQVEYNIIRQRLIHSIGQDKNTGENELGYHIRSLYFDDIYRTAYKDKINGILNRNKYRVRIYNLSDEKIRFEAKIKKGEMVRKEQMSIDKNTYDKITTGDVSTLFSENAPGKIKYFASNVDRLFRPVIIVDYLREAYTYEHGNVRITFDKELKFALNSVDIFDENIVLKEYFEEPVMIMEVKFDNYLPNFIRNLIQIDKFQQSSFSKYANCMTALKPFKAI